MSEKLILPKTQAPQMFDKIARRYDLLNRLLSLGMDISWRNRLKALCPKQKNLKVLDLASGTADVIITLVEGNENIEEALGIDPAVKMLDVGREKIERLGLSSRIRLQEGDAQNLELDDNRFDVVTIAFGIRNVPDMRRGLLEMYRVTKQGGQVMILEFSKPSNPILAAGHWLYLSTIVPCVGFLFSGNIKAYQYLSQTIQSFPYGDRFCKILNQFGFINVRAYPLLGGVATIYVAQK